MFYLVVGVDQEGDVVWSVSHSQMIAMGHAIEMSEVAFDGCIKLYAIDNATLGEREIPESEWK
jgi:hypothetical protein